MNHRKIRPMLKEGSDPEDYDESDIAGYHMTNRRRSRTYPIGYCRDHEPHETKEEAAKCYENYVMEEFYEDEQWSYNEKQRDNCVACEEWGRYRYFPAAYSPLPPLWACEDHATKETMMNNFEIKPSYYAFGSF